MKNTKHYSNGIATIHINETNDKLILEHHLSNIDFTDVYYAINSLTNLLDTFQIDEITNSKTGAIVTKNDLNNISTTINTLLESEFYEF